MGIVHEHDFLVFPIDPVHQDIMSDVEAPVPVQRFFQGLASLRVFCELQQFLLDLPKPRGVFLPHFPEYGLDFRIRNYRITHCLIFRMKSSIEGYVFPFPFASPEPASLIFLTYAGLIDDSGG